MHRLPAVARSRTVRVVAVLGVVAASLLALANLVVLARVDGRATDDVARVRHAQVAIVPGALVDPSGRMSAMLADRVAGAVRLYRAGTVDRILLSGDHGRLGYDEPGTMRAAVLAAGVPARDVFTDHAGFDTWSTMARARRIFRVRSAVVVTQGFHMARALDLGAAAGVDVHGLTVGGGYGGQGRRSALREVVARAKGLSQATLKPSVLGGPVLPITGDGRASWGPVDRQAPVAQLP